MSSWEEGIGPRHQAVPAACILDQEPGGQDRIALEPRVQSPKHMAPMKNQVRIPL